MRARIQLIAFAILLGALPAAARADEASKAAGLRVEVTGFRNDKGQLGCSLWLGPAGFPRDDSHVMKDVWAPIKSARGECVFGGPLPAGDYAVTLFHDENKNGKFDSNFIGFPLEGYGFSNNVVPVLKAPSFNDCKFHYDGTGWKQIPVKMIYR